MGKTSGNLQNRLDREIQDVVEGYLELDPRMSTLDIYDSIQKSRNWQLKRKPKSHICDSIERALEILQPSPGEEEVDSDDLLSEAEKQIQEPSNLMNRSVAKAMARQSAAQIATQSQTNGVVPKLINGNGNSNTDEALPPAPDSPKPQKRKAEPSTARPSKRPRKSETSVLPAPTHVSLADIGGMDHVIEEFKEYLMLPLKRPQRYMSRGLKIPRGILLHGPPGCGKTMLCEAVAGELGLPWLPIQGPAIVSGMSGESEKALRQHFEAAIEAAPCIMFIDEIDAITPKRETAQREMERRIVGQLLTCMDDLALEKTGGRPVIVLAATNRPDSLDPALRRAGRFDTEINIGVPNDAVRESILRAQTRRTELADDVDFGVLAKKTPGFVGADLESLIYKAGSESNARYLRALKEQSEAEVSIDSAMEIDGGLPEQRSPPVQLSETVASFRQLKNILDDNREPTTIAGSDAITMADFLAAIDRVQPSAKREGFATIPNTTWANIGALEEVQKQLHNAIVEPIRDPKKYERFGINIPAGVLLWGPPGCGKTLVAKAVANESKANFISVKGPELLNKYVGESERAIRQVFFRAASSAPCVVFFDELDALVPRRDDSLSDASARVVNTLLTELDGLNARKDIYVIAATNRPEMIDPAMLRPGRLGKHLQVSLPGPKERVQILWTLLEKMPVQSPGSQDRDGLAAFAASTECNNFSGADLGSLAYEAAQQAVQHNAEYLTLAHLESVVRDIKPSVTPEDLEKYTRFKDGFSSSRDRRGIPS